jgi:hypothetical protein
MWFHSGIKKSLKLFSPDNIVTAKRNINGNIKGAKVARNDYNNVLF